MGLSGVIKNLEFFFKKTFLFILASLSVGGPVILDLDN